MAKINDLRNTLEKLKTTNSAIEMKRLVPYAELIFRYRSSPVGRLKQCKTGFEAMVKFIYTYTNYKKVSLVNKSNLQSAFYNKIINEPGLSEEQKYYLRSAFNFILIDTIFFLPNTIKFAYLFYFYYGFK